MSAVEILASGAKSDAGSGSAVDVSAFSTLRLNWSVVADLGRNPQVELYVDSGPSSSGPWTELSHISLRADQAATWAHSTRLVLAGFDSFVRARWSGHARGPVPRDDAGAKFNLGLAGDGQPDSE